jgi:hypothetical protein
MAAQTPAKQLYDMLVSKNFDLDLLDTTGRPSQNPAETDIFSFNYTADSGNDYGTIVIMLADDNDLQVYFGDNLGKGMEQEDKRDWFDFLYQLKQFSTRNLMSFSLKNLNRLKYSMQGQASINEGLFESWSGTRTQSWNGKATEARLMIKHSKPIHEGEKRYRYVESLFIETNEGERYKLPFTKLSGGRAMVEHVRNGGKVYDVRGQHITEMVQELNVLSRFRRANHGKIFEGDTAQLVEQTNAYYENLQRNLKHISNNRGYAQYFESWQPLEMSEQEVVIEGLKHLFVTQSIDQRIEQALPLLARIQQQGTAMKEANIFEAWANKLMEGTWALPDTKEKQQQLVTLLSKDLPVGADATNATEQLYDLLGDDQLFDALEALADQDANADSRQLIYDRMQELADYPEVAEVMNQLTIDTDTPVDENAQPEVDADFSLEEGQMKQMLWDLAERMERDQFIDYTATEMGMDEAESAEFWDSINGDLDESTYPEYQDDLNSILNRAGVEPQNNPAPDYEPEVKEGMLGTLAGGAVGALAGGPVGARIGATLGGAAQDMMSDDDEDELEETVSLQGQYGHSGKMQAVDSLGENIVNRLKELSGLLRTK